jgi:hypothetical protein
MVPSKVSVVSCGMLVFGSCICRRGGFGGILVSRGGVLGLGSDCSSSMGYRGQEGSRGLVMSV